MFIPEVLHCQVSAIMVSSRTPLKITLVIAALIITSTVVATSPVEAKGQTVQWTWHGVSTVNSGNPSVSPNGDILIYSISGANATLYSISPEGKDLWNVSLPLLTTPRFSADGTMFVLVDLPTNSTVNGTGLLVLSADGIVKWTFTIPGVANRLQVLPDGGVVLGAEPSYAGQFGLMCLNADGSVRWTKGAYVANSPDPVMYPVGIRGNDVLVASTSFASPGASVIREYAPDGVVVRSFKTDFAPQTINFALDGTMRTMGYNFSRADSEYLYGLSVNGSFLWATQTNNEYGDLAVLSDGTTVYGERTGSLGLTLNIYAVDSNGNSLWTSVNAKTIPVAFGSGVLFASSTALSLVDRDGGVSWTLNGSYYGQPVVNGQTIYAGTGSDLVAISGSAWNISWQPVVLVLTIMIASIGVWLLSGRSPRLN
jgi:hypothetical protein